MPTATVFSKQRLILLSLALAAAGCKDLTGSPGLPSGTPNPDIYNSVAGAVGLRNAAIFQLENTIPTYVLDAGLLTDELEDHRMGASAGVLLANPGVTDGLDERILPEGSNGRVDAYAELHQVRGFANLALGALALYDTAKTDSVRAKTVRGELYAVQGYAEILLADLFCSGVPLSTLVYHGDFLYAPSSSRDQVYHAAIAKFDGALTLAAHVSDSVTRLAQVLKGRAYLDLGQYAVAADDVATVPSDFLYQVVVQWNDNQSSGQNSANVFLLGSVANAEGHNGLPYRNGDPRTAAIGFAVDPVTNDSLYFPAKYSASLSGTTYAPFTLASGVEARLIQAEAALLAGDAPTWLATLNQLRATAPIPGTTTPDPADLPQLSDPGDSTARLKLMFAERAAWLFVDGHRQGDLRRLLRQHSRNTAFDQSKVYPTGAYLAPGIGSYGSDVTAPIAATDEAPNPYFHGCLDRNP